MSLPGQSGGDSDTGSIEVELTTDRRGAEVLSLELRRLAKAHGLEIGSVTVMPAGEDATSSEGATSP
jgi:hypothetical protein